MAAFNKFDNPSPRLIQPAKTWVIDEGSKMHPALGTPSRLDYQRAEFTRRQPSIDLAEAISRYESSAGKQALIDFGSKKDWTWNDVLEEAENARKAYDAAGQGTKGAMRRFFRHLGDNEPSLSPWICWIPNDKYLSLLHGGLTLLFAAARTMSERRAQIFRALEDMPDTMNLAYAVRETFPRDQHLHILATDLHHSLLDAIDHMISWLLEKSSKRPLKALFKGPQYGAIIDEQLQDVERRVTALRDRVDVLRSQSTAKAEAILERLEPQISCMRQMNTTTVTQTRNIHDDMINLRKDAGDILTQTTGLASQTGMFRTLMDQLFKMQSQFDERLKEQGAGIQRLEENSAMVQQAQGQQLESYATQPQLLELLSVDSSMATLDSHYVLVQGQMVDDSPEVRYLTQTQQFQEWLSQPMSTSAFINGNDLSHALARISPFTVLCSLISVGVNQLPNATSIHFYCGLHTSSDDNLSGPCGLLRSLIAQLLLGDVNYDLHFISSRQYFADLECYDIEYLYDTFEQLVRQLPADSTLFCLIDGIVLFDRSTWRDDLSTLLLKLTALATGRSRIGPRFKLLMTNARCSKQLRELIPPQDYIELSDMPGLRDEAITERGFTPQILNSTSSLGRISNTKPSMGSTHVADEEEAGEDIDGVDDEDSYHEDHESEIDDYNEWPV